MEYKKRLDSAIRVDFIVDSNSEMEAVSKETLDYLLKKFKVKRGAIYFLNPIERKLVPLAKKGRGNKRLVKISLREKTPIIKNKSISVPIMINKKVFGVIYLQGSSIDKDSKKELNVIENILDGRFRNEYESKSLKSLFSKYVGEETLSKILKEPHKEYMTGERNNCSVMFVDINNFSNYSNENSAERVMEFLNYFFSKMSKIILRNNGTIDKFIGDEIMIIFGSPLPKKNHSSIAVKTAKQMLKKMKSVARKYNVKDSGLSIGIATGRVVVGSVGSKKRMQYTAVGKKVNLASRLTNFAGRNEIIIDDTTAQNINKSKLESLGKKI